MSYNIAIDAADGALEELSQPMTGDGNVVFPSALDGRDHPNLISAYETIKNLVEQHGNPFPGNVLVRHYSNAYRAQDIHILDGPRLPTPY